MVSNFFRNLEHKISFHTQPVHRDVEKRPISTMYQICILYILEYFVKYLRQYFTPVLCWTSFSDVYFIQALHDVSGIQRRPTPVSGAGITSPIIGILCICL
jgi:hypothetical protein